MLPHYFGILKGKKKSRYLIAKELHVDISLSATTEELWKVHKDAHEKMRRGETGGKGVSYLELKIELAKRMAQSCRFCEWKCGVDRREKVGVCGVDIRPSVSSYFLHFGEEPVLIPSGTLFFRGCNFKCVYCQNWEISRFPNGPRSNPEELAEIAMELWRSGARNINYVGGDPIPNIHAILESMRYQTANIPQLWNSNFYHTPDSLELILDVIDIWLPDFKYGNNECGMIYSKIPRYFDVVARNHAILSKYKEDTIIRHLVLPGHVECCTYPVLEWIAKNFPTAVVNVMAQYHPDNIVSSKNYPEINRRPSGEEMRKAYNKAKQLNLVLCL